MLRAWLLLFDILIRIGLVKLPQREQSEELERHDFDRNQEQQHRNCNEDSVD